MLRANGKGCRNMSGAVCFFVAIAAIMFASKASLAKSAEDRVAELEVRLEQMEKTYLDNNRDIASAVNEAKSLVDQTTSIKGNLETIDHKIDMQGTNLSRNIDSLERRMEALEQRLAIFTAQMSQVLAKVSPEVASEGDLYRMGLEKAEQGSYMEAVSYFNQFLSKHPKSNFAPEASYWLGECYMSLRDYKMAIKSYQKFIEQNQKHEKVPAAIFNQGVAFKDLGFKEDAKLFFDKVIKEYPTSPFAAKAQSKLMELNTNQTAVSSTAPVVPSSYPEKTVEQQRSGAKITEGDLAPTEEKKQPATTTPPKANKKTDEWPRGDF